MRRVTKRYLKYAQALIFACLLATILIINLQPTSSDKTYAWDQIRYKTTSSKLPEALGICPGLASSDKPALVVARVTADGDTRWLSNLASQYHLCIYTVDSLQQSAIADYLQVPANRGHEAMAYLTFLIDNYERIPEAGAVFVHGSRFAWHNDSPDYDNAALLKTLNMTSALEPYGYANLRCDWRASTCDPKEAAPQGSLETLFTSRLQPWDKRAVSDAALPKTLQLLFSGTTKGAHSKAAHLLRSDAIRAQCCAQFAVSRRNIYQHSLDEYVALRQWLLDDGAAPSDDKIAGRILSYIWHILFMDSANGSMIDLRLLNKQACPSAETCYCRLYGRCDLVGCDEPGRCRGQYVVPPGFRLPDNWEEEHGGWR